MTTLALTLAPTPTQVPVTRRLWQLSLALLACQAQAGVIFDHAANGVFLQGRAVLLKPSPLHRVLAPHFQAALAPLVDTPAYAAWHR